jgi:RNA polymerase sigma factor (sigma-70 family)
MKDLRVEFKFKNAILLQRLKDKFGESASLMDMSRAIGVGYTTLVYLLSLAHSPFAIKGRQCGAEINGIRYSVAAMKIANYLDYSEPAELFPVSLYSIRFPKKYYQEFNSVQFLSLQEAAAQKLLPPAEVDETDMDLPFLKEDMGKLLKTLTAREEKVIKLRYGIGGAEEMSLEEVSEVFQMSRERIRQIEWKALKKLRHPARSMKLKTYHGPEGVEKALRARVLAEQEEVDHETTPKT